MGLLSTVVEKVSDNPVLFIFFRGILENDFKAIRAQIKKEMRPGKGLRTLDLGCGPGAFADAFAGDDYYGADLNARYIEWAKQHRKGNFLACDARSVPLPDQRFDQVLIFGLLHHLSDDVTREVLRETRRLLVPGGRALVIEDIPAVSKLNLIGHLIHHIENGEYIRPQADYRRLFEESFTIENEEILRSGICDYYKAVLVK
jgi:ubiquinone/menaquinone biosynthesis C-methylase UbiE